ncbi:unnamed protein product [Caenorhabditis sp. 36 PRJEB53466]|nr:unnamed protein product [Caenorhabditis sp. 36 PRJEB53466]
MADTAAVNRDQAAVADPPATRRVPAKRGKKAAAPKSPAAAPKAAAPKAAAPKAAAPKAAAVKKTSAVVATASPSPAPTKIPRIRTQADHPSYIIMIKEAIATLKERKGASTQAIFKHVSTNFNVVQGSTTEKQVKSRLNIALKKGVTSGALVQTSGTGANGRFRLKADTPKKVATSATVPVAAPVVSSSPTTPVATKPKKTIKKMAVAAVSAIASPIEKKNKSPKKVAAKPAAKKSKKAPAQKAAATD